MKKTPMTRRAGVTKARIRLPASSEVDIDRCRRPICQGLRTGPWRVRRGFARRPFGPIALGDDVEDLDHRRERHRRIEVAARDVEADAVGNQRRADHQQEGERQHARRRVPVDEAGDRAGGGIHDGYRKDDRGDHHADMLGHADRGDDRVDREDHVDERDLRDDHAEARGDLRPIALFVSPSTSRWISRVALTRRNRPPASRIRSRQEKPWPNEGEERRREVDQPEQREQEDDAEDERHGQAELAGPLRLMRRQASRRSPR